MSSPFDRSRSRPARAWPSSETSAPVEDATVIVLGNPHGGTTLIAGLLRLAGINLGTQIDSWTQEDIEMRSNDVETLRTAIETRNKRRGQWGWKCPGSAPLLLELQGSLRNPCFVAIFRDPLATVLRRIDPEKRDPIELYEEWIQGAQCHVDTIKCFKAPTLFVSYELALKKPAMLVEDVCRFVGRELDEELRTKMLAYIKPDGGYGDQTNLINGPIESLPFPLQSPPALSKSDRRLRPLELVRPHGIRWTEDQWELVEEDSWCFVRDEDLLQFPKASRIRIEIQLSGEDTIAPSLYLDIGHGLCEEHRIRFGELDSGTWEFEVDLPETTGAARFDPDEKSGRIEKLVLSIG